MLRTLLLLALGLVVPSCGRPVAANDASTLLQPLIDPAKLATLGDRGTNTRIQKVTAILWQAKVNGQDPAKVADKAVELIGWAGTNPLFPAIRSGHRLFQRPSPGKQFPSNEQNMRAVSEMVTDYFGGFVSSGGVCR
jgi:hypothetical protein